MTTVKHLVDVVDHLGMEVEDLSIDRAIAQSVDAHAFATISAFASSLRYWADVLKTLPEEQLR